METYLCVTIVLLIVWIIILLHNSFVSSFKIGYYEARLRNNGLDDSVKDIKTIFDIKD